jgi:hypothetical protein
MGQETEMDWDFSTNASIDEETYGKVPEGYRGAYEKGEDGKYGIAPTAKPFVDAIVGLRGALNNERKATKDLKGQKDVAAVIKETFGFETVEEAKAKFDEYAKAAAEGAKVDPAKIKADIEATFNKERAKSDEKVQKMQGTLERYLVDGAAKAAIAAAKGNAVLLAPHIASRVKVVEDGDEYVVRVLDAQGDYRGDGMGGFMTVEALVAEMKGDKTFAGAFESEAPGGSDVRQGRQPSQAQRVQSGATRREDMSPQELLTAGLQARRRGR